LNQIFLFVTFDGDENENGNVYENLVMSFYDISMLKWVVSELDHIFITNLLLKYEIFFEKENIFI
jgi:6-pyruvoyl-tetrahydropterin synthase